MKVEQKYLQRFEELIGIGEGVLQTKFSMGGGGFSFDMVDSSASYEWGMKCLSTLSKVFGENNRYYIEFNNLFEGFSSIVSYENTRKAIAVLKAAKGDYKDGYSSKEKKENIAKTFNTKSIPTQNEIDAEAKRNTRIYSIIIFVMLAIIVSTVFYFFSINLSFITFTLLIVGYFLSRSYLKNSFSTK